MRRAAIAAFAFALLPAIARAEESSPPAAPSSTPAPDAAAESRPGVINETAAVPRATGGWVTASGGSLAGGRLAFDGAAMVSPFSRIAIGAGASAASGTTSSPWAGAYAQLLTQEGTGLDVTTSVRVRAVAPESAGSQIAGRVVVGRAIGPTYLAVNGGIARSVGTRQDVDWESGGLFFARIARIVRVGAEGRVRGEAVETYVTAEDMGRPVDVLGGGTVGVDFERVLVQTLGGWSWPRGTLAAGPVVLGAATVTF